MAPTFSDVTPAGLTKAEFHGLAAKALGLDADHIVDVALVAKVSTGTKRGFAFGGLGDPIDQGKFLAEALDFLGDGLIDQLVAEAAKQLGIALTGDGELDSL